MRNVSLRSSSSVQRAEFLDDFGMVAVSVQGVSLEVLVDLGEVEVNRPSPARARNAGFGVNHHVRLYHAGGHGGREGEDGGGRVATRIADQRRLRYLLAVEFGQAVNGGLHVLRAWMLNLVPVRIVVQVLEAEVGGNVHRLDALLDERLKPLGAGGVGQRGEHEVNALGYLRRYLHVAVGQVGEHLRQSPARRASSGDGRYLNFGVATAECAPTPFRRIRLR